LPTDDHYEYKTKNPNVKILKNTQNYATETENATRLFNKDLNVDYKYLKPIDQAVPNEWLSVEDNFVLFLVVNLPLMGMDFVVCPHAKFDDGQMNLAFVREGISKYELFKFLVQCSEGTILENSHVEWLPVKAFRLEPLNSKELSYGSLMIDGESVPYGPIQGEVFPELARALRR
jgi:sphingosine kinase